MSSGKHRRDRERSSGGSSTSASASTGNLQPPEAKPVVTIRHLLFPSATSGRAELGRLTADAKQFVLRHFLAVKKPLRAGEKEKADIARSYSQSSISFEDRSSSSIETYDADADLHRYRSLQNTLFAALQERLLSSFHDVFLPPELLTLLSQLFEGHIDLSQFYRSLIIQSTSSSSPKPSSSSSSLPSLSSSPSPTPSTSASSASTSAAAAASSSSASSTTSSTPSSSTSSASTSSSSASRNDEDGIPFVVPATEGGGDHENGQAILINFAAGTTTTNQLLFFMGDETSRGVIEIIVRCCQCAYQLANHATGEPGIDCLVRIGLENVNSDLLDPDTRVILGWWLASFLLYTSFSKYVRLLKRSLGFMKAALADFVATSQVTILLLAGVYLHPPNLLLPATKSRSSRLSTLSIPSASSSSSPSTSSSSTTSTTSSSSPSPSTTTSPLSMSSRHQAYLEELRHLVQTELDFRASIASGVPFQCASPPTAHLPPMFSNSFMSSSSMIPPLSSAAFYTPRFVSGSLGPSASCTSIVSPSVSSFSFPAAASGSVSLASMSGGSPRVADSPLLPSHSGVSASSASFPSGSSGAYFFQSRAGTIPRLFGDLKANSSTNENNHWFLHHFLLGLNRTMPPVTPFLLSFLEMMDPVLVVQLLEVKALPTELRGALLAAAKSIHHDQRELSDHQLLALFELSRAPGPLATTALIICKLQRIEEFLLTVVMLLPMERTPVLTHYLTRLVTVVAFRAAALLADLDEVLLATPVVWDLCLRYRQLLTADVQLLRDQLFHSPSVALETAHSCLVYLRFTVSALWRLFLH